ncbi:MAG: hypothetical protein ACQESR_30810, partial [Planctomycetota bacterium]
MLSTVFWDGGPSGTGTDWHNPINWVDDALPATGDDAVITDAFANVTITSGSDVTVKKLTSDASISNAAGTFTMHGTSAINGTLTNASGGTVRLEGSDGGHSVLTVNTGLTNRGTLELTSTTNLASGRDSRLIVGDGELV